MPTSTYMKISQASKIKAREKSQKKGLFYDKQNCSITD